MQHQAAANDSVLVAINSGFRSHPEQKYLYEGISMRVSL
jgi:hypothetical protein